MQCLKNIIRAKLFLNTFIVVHRSNLFHRTLFLLRIIYKIFRKKDLESKLVGLNDAKLASELRFFRSKYCMLKIQIFLRELLAYV